METRSMRLYGTPLSHFTRKVRIVLAELGAPFEMVWTPSVLASSAGAYGDNPLLRVPTLVHGGETIFDSDSIARYLARLLDTADRLGVHGEAIAESNRIAVVNGIMASEVVLILAKRGGVADIGSIAYFRKLTAAIESGLAWLDAHTEADADGFRYADVVTICMWQHVTHYGLVNEPSRFGRLAARVARFEDRPSVAATTPDASLAAARAAGWTPG